MTRGGRGAPDGGRARTSGLIASDPRLFAPMAVSAGALAGREEASDGNVGLCRSEAAASESEAASDLGKGPDLEADAAFRDQVGHLDRSVDPAVYPGIEVVFVSNSLPC